MSESRKYAVGQLFIFPLVADGAVDFVTDYTPAAGDVKVWTDKLISTNLTSLILGFDSLSELPAQGAQIDENGAGTAEGVVEFTIITSGTVGGGDAAGFFIMRSVTGQAWSNDDQIDINGGSTNIATADSTTHDLAATAGLIGAIGNGLFAVALSPTEMTCSQGSIHVVDSATKAIEDQAILFTTYGNASSQHAFDLDTASTAQTADHTSAIADVPTVAEFNARTLVAASYFDPAADAVANVTLCATTTTNTDMVGTDSAALASVCTEGRLAELDAGNLPTDVAAIPTTAMRGTDSAALASVCTNGRLAELDAANLPSDIDAIQTDLDNTTDGLGALKALIDTIDVYFSGARSEPGQGAPAVDETLLVKIDFLYKAWRNNITQAPGLYSLFNDAGNVVDQKAPTGDQAGSTFISKVVSGP